VKALSEELPGSNEVPVRTILINCAVQPALAD